MMPIQIILLIFFVFAALRVLNRYRSKDLTVLATFGWLAFWFAAGIVVVVPDSTFSLARLVGVTRGADLVVYVALVILFFITFRSMVRQEKLQRDITLLTRRMTLEKNSKDIKV